jgi:hypothetical protein
MQEVVTLTKTPEMKGREQKFECPYKTWKQSDYWQISKQHEWV